MISFIIFLAINSVLSALAACVLLWMFNIGYRVKDYNGFWGYFSFSFILGSFLTYEPLMRGL